MRGKCQATGGFVLVVLWFAAVNGWQALMLVLSAAAVHEAGHYLALRWLGGRFTGLRLTLFGAEMETDNRRVSYGGEVLAALAGPGANLLCAWLLLWADGNGWTEWIGANITLALFNLLPIRPLDGGRALWQLTAWMLGPAAGDAVCRCTATVFGTALAALLGYVMHRTGGSLWLLPPTAGILTAVWQEWRGRKAPGDALEFSRAGL